VGHWPNKRTVCIASAFACALTCAFGEIDLVGAAWHGNGAGQASSKARTMPAGNMPTTSIEGRNVTVQWAPANLSNGGPPVGGYILKRYDTDGNEHQVVSSCAGTIADVSCRAVNVPPGSWRYAVVPRHGNNWIGAESDRSAPRVVPSPAYTLSSASTVGALPATVNGDLAAFETGATVTYRLDDPVTGQVLGSTTNPSSIGNDGAATNAVTIPAGTANGSHTIYAIGSGGDQASAAITVAAPEVTATTIDKSVGCAAGSLRQGGTYRVYANVSNGPSAVSADVGNLTTGQTSVGLSSGSWTVDGVAYNYRSAALTANGSLAEGNRAYSVAPAGGSAGSGTVAVDNTAPAGTDVQTTNVAGGTSGKAELGDALVLTYSEPMDSCSLVAGWDGAGTTNVVVRIPDTKGKDNLEVWNAANTDQLPLGAVELNTDAVGGGGATFGATGTPSTLSISGGVVTVTLGTPSGSVQTDTHNTANVWTPSATAFDRAGNGASASAATESGALDFTF
jgi:hypothetical protein